MADTLLPAGVVSCQAKASASKLALAASLPAVLAAHPALAVVSVRHLQLLWAYPRGTAPELPGSEQVDERLGGEGTSKILGISSVEGWPIIIVLGLVWALYYASQKDLDAQNRGEGDDSGVGL